MNLSDRIAASSITFRDEPLEQALQRLRDLGFLRFDLTAIRRYCNHFDPLLVDVGEVVCTQTRDLVDKYGLQAISLTTYPANPLARDLNGDDWVEGVDAYVRLGLFLKPDYLILPPGSPAPAADRWRGTAEHALPWQRDAVQRVLNAHMQPAIALQSNSLLRTSREAVDFLRILDMMDAGLAVDPAHLAAVGEDPAEAIRAMGNAIMYVVLRDTDGTDYNLTPGQGTLDYPGILAALDDVGYDGPLVLAVDDVSVAPEQRAELLKRGWEYLDRTAQRKAA